MGLRPGDRVRLNRDGAPEGTVKGAVFDGAAYVQLDHGVACTFRIDELDVLAPESKSWPPEGIETKAQ